MPQPASRHGSVTAPANPLTSHFSPPLVHLLSPPLAHLSLPPALLLPLALLPSSAALEWYKQSREQRDTFAADYVKLYVEVRIDSMWPTPSDRLYAAIEPATCLCYAATSC